MYCSLYCFLGLKMAGENKLSDKVLKGYMGKSREKQITVADGKGLSVRVSKKGAVSFVFFYRVAR